MMRWLTYLAILAASAAFALPADAQVTDGERAAVQAAYVAGDHARAEQMVTALLERSPQDPDLLRRLAAVQAAKGDLGAAQATIDRAYGLAPRDPDIQLARANILFWRGRYAEAGRQADLMASQHPDYPGLQRLKASLSGAMDARRFRLRSADIGGSVSDASFAFGSRQTWYVQRGSVAAQWGDGRSASLGIEREERLVTDTQIAGRIDIAGGRHRFFVTVRPGAWAAGQRSRWAMTAPFWSTDDLPNILLTMLPPSGLACDSASRHACRFRPGRSTCLAAGTTTASARCCERITATRNSAISLR
jgi:hypothetical protein